MVQLFLAPEDNYGDNERQSGSSFCNSEHIFCIFQSESLSLRHEWLHHD